MQLQEPWPHDDTAVAASALLRPLFLQRNRLLSICLRWTKGRLSEAEDLLSEACVRALEAEFGPTEELHDPLSFWATVIANLARDRQRSAWGRRVELSEPGTEHQTPCGAPGPDEQVESRQTLHATLSRIPHLSERQRQALMMRTGGAEYNHIAILLGTSTVNVRKLVQVARDSLRNRSRA